MARAGKPKTPFYRFNSSPEVIRMAVMLYVRYPLSLRNVEDLLFERGADICHETVRFWWNRFGPMFAAEIRRKRVDRIKAYNHWRWQAAKLSGQPAPRQHCLKSHENARGGMPPRAIRGVA
jgi:putative transposase